MVLLVALIVLGVVGTLLVASYFAQRERWAVRLVAGRSAQLRAAAGGAAADVRAGWDSAARFRQAPGSTAALAGPWTGVAGTVDARVTRLSVWSYRATVRVADARDTALAARASALLTVAAPRFPAWGALVAAGDVSADGTLVVAVPDSGARCGPPAGWRAGIVTPPGHSAPAGAGADAGAGAAATYEVFGGTSRAALATRASDSLPAGSVVPAPVGGVVHALGDLELTGGAGSGVLLVDGALRISGSIVFRGVIVVAGALEVSGGESSISGMLLIGGGRPSVDVNALAGMSLQYDSCVIEDAEWHAGAVRFVSGPGDSVSASNP